MGTWITVLSAALAVTFAVSGVAMLRGRPLLASAAHRALSTPTLRTVGTLELAGTLGLATGLFVTAVGPVAAAGVLTLNLGAITAHLRVRDSLTTTTPAIACTAATLTLLGLYARSGWATPL